MFGFSFEHDSLGELNRMDLEWFQKTLDYVMKLYQELHCIYIMK